MLSVCSSTRTKSSSSFSLRSCCTCVQFLVQLNRGYVGMAKLGVDVDASCVITHVFQPCLVHRAGPLYQSILISGQLGDAPTAQKSVVVHIQSHDQSLDFLSIVENNVT